jgi:hypothetical protein
VNGVGVAGYSHSSHFVWHTVDLRSMLPPGWQQQALDVVRRCAKRNLITPTSVTSRERYRSSSIPTSIVDGTVVHRELPWLAKIYLDVARETAQKLCAEPVTTAHDIRAGLNLHIQRGRSERYECHVDSSPLTGLLYVTDHPRGTGGELVVANRGDVGTVEDVDADATHIYPVSGHLLVFDARRHSHYVAPLHDPGAIRVVAPMTFFTPSCPESARPADLDGHLGLV